MADNAIILDTDDKVHTFFGQLAADGWDGTLTVFRPLNANTRTYLIDVSRNGQTVKVQTGWVAVPLNSGSRYLQYTQDEYTELQTVFGGGV